MSWSGACRSAAATSERVGRWDPHLRWLYVLLLLASGYVVLDALLPTRVLSSRVVDAEELKVNVSSRRSAHANYVYWTVVSLDNGISFQTQNGASGFPIGSGIQVEVTRIRERVVRYQPPGNGRYGWNEVEAANKEFLAFPALAAVLSLLLLLPWWSMENRWLLNGLLILVLGAWLLTMVGTSVMTAFS